MIAEKNKRIGCFRLPRPHWARMMTVMAIEVNPDDSFHVLIGQQVMPLSLDALDDAYQAEKIDDATLIWQQGLGEWMRLDAVLQQLEQQDRTVQAHTAPMAEDTFFVLLAENDVKQMTLDQLDDSYRLDIIDDGTLVWQPGFTEWVPLQVLIGEVEEAQPVSIAPSSAYSAPAHSAPAYSTSAFSAPGAGAPPSSLGGMAVGHPESIAPLSLGSVTPPSQASAWFSRSLIAMASVASLFVLHQNGVTHSVADALDQKTALGRLEERAGGPNVWTEQGVDVWLSRLNERYALDALSETEPVPASRADAEAEERSETGDASQMKEPGDGATKEKAEPQAEKSGNTDGPQAEGQKKGDEQKSTSGPDPAAAAFGAKLQGKKAAPAPARRAAPRKKAAPKPSFRATGDPNDPMNGAL